MRRQYRAQSDAVEDVVQDAFRKLWERLANATAEEWRQEWGGWIFRVANNAMLDRTRTARRHASEPIDDMERTAGAVDRAALQEGLRGAMDGWQGNGFLGSDEDGAMGEGTEERLDAMRAVLRELPDRDRVLLTLKYMDGLSYEQIAERTGYARGALGTLLLRARRAAEAGIRRVQRAPC